MKTYDYFDSQGFFRGTLEAKNLEQALRLATSFITGAMVRLAGWRVVAVFNDREQR